MIPSLGLPSPYSEDTSPWRVLTPPQVVHQPCQNAYNVGTHTASQGSAQRPPRTFHVLAGLQGSFAM